MFGFPTCLLVVVSMFEYFPTVVITPSFQSTRNWMGTGWEWVGIGWEYGLGEEGGGSTHPSLFIA